jgi:hypothetical protein
MNTDPIVMMTTDQLFKLNKLAAKEALMEFDQERIPREQMERTYKRSDIARKLKIAPSTVTKLIKEGKLKTTRDGKWITGKSFTEFLALGKSDNK